MRIDPKDLSLDAVLRPTGNLEAVSWIRIIKKLRLYSVLLHAGDWP
jgi:hypothetical protein